MNLTATPERGLKTGDLVTLEGRRYVVESVNGTRFTDTYGASHRTDRAEIVPLAAATGKAA